MPATALTLVVPPIFPPTGPLKIATVTLAVLLVMTVPREFSTMTVGAGAIGVLMLTLLGCTPKPNRPFVCGVFLVRTVVSVPGLAELTDTSLIKPTPASAHKVAVVVLLEGVVFGP